MRVLGTALKTYKTSLAIKQCLPRKAEAALRKNAERATALRLAMLNVGIEVRVVCCCRMGKGQNVRALCKEYERLIWQS